MVDNDTTEGGHTKTNEIKYVDMNWATHDFRRGNDYNLPAWLEEKIADFKRITV